ncbi:MAG: hypothetical protein GFH27_549313n21 [Chloroflexi bacterium AL-W]|nr:hypothetical protein [Chloroflexi bacterium AL-N1]NOK69444.1 hypothetical protein [Chloroflexi bacterium AL-N10]NOK77409.1 hypothetical protein [Chloroflexi bacterium AL-N5]NOK84260.1 hypothetical protein [Chloroflexi bacterium AL-W]NOK91575.1 hypothetical protein [Chloroflexi bacterium AL-N15]
MSEQQRLMALAQRVATEHMQDPNLEAILLTGSVVYGQVDDVSDIDMTLYYADLPSPAMFEAIQQKALGSGGGIYGYDPQEGLACYRFVEGIKVDTGHQTTASLTEMLQKFVAKPDLDNDTHHIIMSGVQRGMALYGDAIIHGWQNQLAGIAPDFFRQLVETNLRFAPRAVLQEMGVERRDYWLVNELILEAQQRILKVICGLNRRIPPGKIKGMDVSLATCAIVPSNVTERLREVWMLPPTEAVAALIDLEQDLLDLVDIHLPQIDTQSERQRLDLPLRKQVYSVMSARAFN